MEYAAHELNLWPRISLPETSPSLRWTGEVGDASVFRDVTFDESVPFYRLFPYRSTPPLPPSLFLAPGPLLGPAPVLVAVGSGAARGAASGGAESRGAEPRGAEPEGVEHGGAASEGAESGAARAGGAGAAGAGGAGGAAATGPGGAHTRGTGAAGSGGVEGAKVVGPGAGGAGAAGAEAGDNGDVHPYARVAGGTVRPRAYFIPLLQQSQPLLQPASPLPTPSPYTEQSGALTEHREPPSRPVSPVRPALHAPRSRPPPVPGMHAMALRPSSVPLRVPLPAPPESSLPEVPDPESDRARAVSPALSRLLATAVTDPSFESAVVSALVAELLDFASACRLDYATALVAESVSASPPFVGGECALSTDVLEDRQEEFECLAVAVSRFASMLLALEGNPNAPDIPTLRSYAEAITGPYSSQWQAAMDAKMASWKSTGTYVDEVPPPGANIVDGMWIFRVKRPPGSPPAFKARYVARGFRQRQGVDYFQTFSPTWKMTTLQVLLHVAAQHDYEYPVEPPPASLRSRQAPREWHDTLRTTLAALGFAPFTADPSLFLRTDTLLPPFYVLVYGDDLVFATTDTEALTLVKSRFSLGSGSVSWRSTRSSSVLNSSCEVEIYAGAMAAQELRWLTYLLTNLGEQPRSPPVL
ncbi:unnamed protein product, partial [Closterium sp. NIES-53]